MNLFVTFFQFTDFKFSQFFPIKNWEKFTAARNEKKLIAAFKKCSGQTKKKKK
jgi:hypothetical protein